jgi:DNA-binding winged helix-turn-helix (wHTH) protein/Tfp pilus assembly protein PilF
MSLSTQRALSRVDKLRFGSFEVDLHNRELRKSGLRIKLQRKPFQILEALLRAPGELVTRGELAGLLWPGLHVNFDRSLNTAVNVLRQALNDSSQNPRFIETRTGLGYRFIAAVEEIAAPSGVPPAYQDYLKGRYFLEKLTEEDLHRSVAYFASARAEDPSYAPAAAGLAEAYILFALLNMLPAKEAGPRAREFAAVALRLDPGLGEAHAAWASVKRWFEWDWAAAETEYAKALELSPGSAIVHRQYGSYLTAMDRPREAFAELERARELEPVSLLINVEIAWALYMARDFAGAAEQAWKTLAIESRYAAAQHVLGLAYEQLGLIEEALVELGNARTCSGDQPATLAALAHLHAAAGKPKEASEMLEALHRLAQYRYVSPYWYAIAYAGLGDDETVREWLAKAFAERDVWLTWAKVEPRLAGFRDTPLIRAEPAALRRTL